MEVEITKNITIVEALVSSESQPGAYYKVSFNSNDWTCSCPDNQKRNNLCKHIEEVRKELRA